MDLILIRHPRVAVDAGVCYGQTDVPLLRDAGESAREIAERLSALNVPPCVDGWHSSPLARCASLARALSRDAPVHVDARLSELDFGAWEGQAWDGIDRALVDAWAADIEHARPHGGESLARFSARVITWLDDRTRDENDEGADGRDKPLHVIAHAGVMRVLAAHVLRVDRANALQWAIDFGAIAWFRRVRGAWVLVRWNG